MSAPPPDPPPEFGQLLDDFQRRLRAGEGPSVDAYAARFPHLADRIREVFPVVVALEQTAAPPVPPHPTKLGDYRIVREVGRGGMGVVYEAVQESLGRRVAVKVFPAAHLGRHGLRERFAREAQAAGRLHHTNIVPVFGVGEQDGVPFFAMQFISGCGLDRVIAAVRADRTPAGDDDLTTPHLLTVVRRPPRPALSGRTGPAYFRTAARLMLEAADALAHAHAHGVQHRDIKPGNLLLDDHGTLWVTDFGLAKLDDASDLTRSGEHLGTLRYAPPERFRGGADERADLYSLGATFYELLALRPAFAGTDTLALIDAIKATVPPSPRSLDPAVPRDLDTVCLKCLEKEPGRRYPTAEALAADLRAFLDGRAITARRVGPVEAAGKWVRRKPVTATLLAAGLLMLVGAAGLAVLREHERYADRADGLVETLQRADTAELPTLLRGMDEYRWRVRPALLALAGQPCTERAGLHARLALLGDDPQHADDICDHLLTCPAGQLQPVRQIAGPHLGRHRGRLWAVLRDPAADPAARVRAAGVLAGTDPDASEWAAVARSLADLLVAIDPVELGPLTRALGPVLPTLTDALEDCYAADREGLTAAAGAAPFDLATRVGRMNAAAVILWQTLDARPDSVAWLAVAAEDAHLAAPLAAVRRYRRAFEPRLRAVLAEPATTPEAARRRAGAAAALLTVAGPNDLAWDEFRHSADPTTRSHLIRRCRPAGVPAKALAERFAAEDNVSARRALLLALAEYPADQLPAGFLDGVAKRYLADPDRGLHAAAGWALARRWGRANSVEATDADLKGKAVGDWFVAPHGGTFAVVPAPGRVHIGTPGAAADLKQGDEVLSMVDVPRRFAIGLTEVTAELFNQWPGSKPDHGRGRVAAGRVSWFFAAAFCNWLSEREGIPPSEWCYEPNAEGKYAAGMRPAPFHVCRTGWRLPTEAEWEVAARAGCPGLRFFGDADGLLTRYAWTPANSGDAPHPVGELRPNDWGLFDVLGNVHEWADDAYSEAYPPGPRLDFGLTGSVEADEDHVLRGGAYNLPENRLRSAYRFNLVPKNRPGSCGFRLARTLR